MEKMNRSDAPAFITKDGSEIREIMAPANSAVGRLSLAEAIVFPGEKTRKHYHISVEEIYYFLSGKGLMWQAGEEVEVSAGDAVANPPGTPHFITNIGEKPLVFLCICSPHYTHEDTVLLED